MTVIHPAVKAPPLLSNTNSFRPVKDTLVLNRVHIVACFAVLPMLTIAACAAGTSKTPADSGGAGGDGGVGESTSVSSGSGGQGGACVKEVCDGMDNDCNGLIDDGFGAATCGLGACKTMVESTCQNGQPVPCVPLMPALEGWYALRAA